MIPRTLIAIIVSLLLCQNIKAQELQATLSHYSTDNGLVSNAISYMAQDDYGYVWLATWNGLSRFDGYNFFNYTTGPLSGIPRMHNRVIDIVIDTQQNVWLRMYDGRVFVLKRSTDSFINPFEGINGNENFMTFSPMTVTSAGDVLVNVDKEGLFKLRVERDRVNVDQITTNGLNVTSMAEGYQNDIWLGTDKGVHRMDIANLSVERKGLFLDEHITSLYSNGYNIYVGTQSGKIMSFSYGQEPKTIRHSGLPVTGVFVDSHGVVWFSDKREGVMRIRPESTDEKQFVQRVSVPDYDGKAAQFREVNGIVWMRMNRGGYGYYNREKDEVEHFHNDPSNPWNLSNSVNASLELQEGVIWESTSRRGLDRLEILKKTIDRIQIYPDAGPSNKNEIRAMAYDTQRQLFIYANKEGTIFFRHQDGTITTLSKDNEGRQLGRIYGISIDSKGTYWVSCKENGIYHITPQGNSYQIKQFRHNDANEWSLNDDRAYETVEDKNGNIWVATYGGGVALMTKSKTGQPVFYHSGNVMKKYPFNAYKKARTVALDNEGNVWAGTTDGILIMSFKDRKLSIEQLKPSTLEPDKMLRSNDVVCLAQDRMGSMWVGTNGGGLSHTIGKDKDGRWLFENFGANDGLPGEEIHGITFDDRGNVWFSTDHILCSFDVNKHIFTTFSNLDGVDETVCSEGAAICLPSGEICFGTVNGYYVVDRSKLVTNNGNVLKLRITDFWFEDELQSPRFDDHFSLYVPECREFELPYHSGQIAFRFASLNYQLQHRVHYQYIMEGYDTEWQNADRIRIASYNNLPTGQYRFKVKAFLLESPDKFDMRQIDIIVPPYFLLSTSAVWLYMVLGIALGIWLLFWRQNRLAKEEKMRELRDGPRQLQMVKHSEKDEDFLLFLNNYLEIHYSDPMLDIEDIVAASDLSDSKFARMVWLNTARTPKDYVIEFRLKKAIKLLEDSDESIADIAFKTGFADPTTFSRHFKKKTTMMPSMFRDLKKKS